MRPALRRCPPTPLRLGIVLLLSLSALVFGGRQPAAAVSLGSRAPHAQGVAALPALAITTPPGSLPDGMYGIPYPTTTLAATGGTPPYRWTRSSGAFPSGLVLSSAGVVSGEPGAAGTFIFTVNVRDSSSPAQTATQQLNITIAAPPALVITTTTLPGGAAGAAYSQTLAAAGGAPPYTWTRSSGTFPSGLVLSSAGVISGEPSAAGTFIFTVRVTDSSSPAQIATQQLSITIAAPPTLVVTTTALPGGTARTAYSQTLAATRGTPPYRWTRSGGTFPSGLVLSSAGVVSGNPHAAGTFIFTVRVTDSSSPAQTTTQQLSITIAAPRR
jgi:Putative Ig domain